MQITFEYIDGRTCPMVLCDICGEKIEDAGKVLIKWDADDPAVNIVCHKGQCDESSPGGRHSPDSWPWQEFSHFWVYVASNSRLNISKATRSAEFMANL